MNVVKIIFYVFLSVLVLGAFYFMTLLGPGKVEEVKFGNIDPVADTDKILKESERLELEFEQTAAAGGTLSQKTIEKLRDAIALQEKYINIGNLTNRAPAERLMKLQTRLQNVESAPLSETVNDLDRRAMEAETAENYQSARDLYKEAYDLQSKINAEYPLSKYKDISRRVEFDRKVKMLEARPTYLKSVELEKRAVAARDAGETLKAKELFEKTLAVITNMHAAFPSSVYTDFARLMRIESELQSLQSGGLSEKIEGYLKAAKEAEAKGDFLSASESYSDAADCQRNINKLYPKSRLVSEERLRELELRKIETYSWKFADEIKKQNEVLVKAIRAGDYSAIPETTANLIRKTEHFTKNYPQSKLLPEDMLMRLRYIDFMSRDIGNIQSQIYSLLLPVPSSKAARKMLKTEITQKIYALVMQENPSRFSENELLPVDSVTFDDVSRFCQRVSWLIGYPVELPSEAEYRAAIGSLRYVDIGEISWNNMNSGGKTHAVATKKPNDNGFFDLLGNVSEFVKKEPADVSEMSRIIGGGAQTSADAIGEIPFQQFDPKQRNRMVGFRIIVDLSEKK